MRNLVLVDKKISFCSFLKHCCAATVERSLLYFATKNELYKLDSAQSSEENVEILMPLDVGIVLDIKYLPEEDVLAIVSQCGSISLYNLTSSEFEVVGDVSGGISACCWSPDMENLVIISETGNVLMMSRTWDVLHEAPLFQDDFGEAKFVSVGWGSKETQFHGSEGKGARNKKEIQSSLLDWDDKRTRIVWRADGLFFAVCAVDPSFDSRLIRVFNREGVLQSTSEQVPQLGQSLSWRSSGASGLITSTVSDLQQGKQQVAFFERNGLRHGEFDIACGHRVLESYWNGDSTILAMLICNEQQLYGLELWTMSNYHWYMKHFVPFKESIRPIWIAWDVIETNRLNFVTSDGAYVVTEYSSVVHSSKDLSLSDPACVAVIDNCILKLSCMREAIVPPPMCAWEIEFPTSIHSVDFMHCSSNRLCVFTNNGLANIFLLTESSTEEKPCNTEVKIICREGGRFRPVWDCTISLDVLDFSLIYHWRLVNLSSVVACSMSKVFVLNISDGSATVRGTFDVDSRVGGLQAVREEENFVFVHLINGKVLRLNTVDIKVSEFIVFPEFCDRVDSINGHVIGLAVSGRLYVDGKEVLSAISSFVVHSDFLLVTSLQKHQLLCLPLEGLSSDIAFTERAVERGAKLVNAIAKSTTVILQMPRGNLEAIHPRALSLKIMKSLINRHSYMDALNLMKRQRINLNLLYDHSPKAFMENCSQFVEQVGAQDVTNLNLFFGELQNEDYTATMYRSYYENKPGESNNGKIDEVCTRLRQVMSEKGSHKYLLPIVTSYIKQGMLDKALKVVQEVIDEPLKDKALKYMAVLVDDEQLYKEALATYDLQLTLMVAHRSQKDPKEYLAFLNELKEMPDENDRRFTIDNFLKRYDLAVRHLCRCRPCRTNDIIAYMKLHKTYSAVVEELCSVTQDSEVRSALHAAAYLKAETLETKQNHEEAGYLYQRVGLYSEAISSFQLCGMWTNCVALAATIQMSESELRSLVSKLVTTLRNIKNYRDASHLAEYYLKDTQLAGQLLIDGIFFSDAWSLSLKYKMADWAENTLKTELNKAFEAIHTRIDNVENECCKYTQRLATVRKDLLYRRDYPSTETDHGDLYSETGSSIFTHTSGTSGRTFRSSKNRRKLERKKLRLKEGSPFEDMAIINELHLLYTSMAPLLQDVGRILRGEALIAMDWSRAKSLQCKAERLLKLMEEKKKEIWNFSVANRNEETDKFYGPSATTEMVVSQKTMEKDEFFAIRYLELDSKLRTPPDSLEGFWKLESLK